MKSFHPILLSLAFAALVSGGWAQGTPPTIQFRIDTAQKRTPISPLIYGTNQTEKLAQNKGLTLTRIGGNRMTAYNWENNASNAGNDYQHQSDDFLDTSDAPGDFIRKNVRAAFDANASIIVTVPMAGYVAAEKNGGGLSTDAQFRRAP